MNWELITTLTGLMLFSYWFNYAMGGPLSEDVKKVDTKAILFFIPNELARRRLKIMGLLSSMRSELITELAMTQDAKVKHGLRQDKRRDIYIAGREFFTWERSILCPVCFHWWLTVIVGAVFLSFDLMGARADLFVAAFTYLVNHLFIRKIS